jgi:DNA-binding NarL/FixJ family response regulator
MAGMLRSQTLLVDDHPLFRAGLCVALQREPDLAVVGEVSTATEAIDVLRREPVDVVVVDVLLPSTNGVSLTRQLHELFPECRILALSVLDEPIVIASMLRAGATGYALKTQSPDQITDAIRVVLTGRRYLPPSVPATLVTSLLAENRRASVERLTPREHEILGLLVRGYTNDEVASMLFIAKRTVETHRQRIMKKLSTHSIVEMVRVAARQGALSE